MFPRKKEKITRYGYMCKKEFEVYLEKGMTSTPIYASKKAITSHKACVKECGVVKVKVEVVDES